MRGDTGEMLVNLIPLCVILYFLQLGESFRLNLPARLVSKKISYGRSFHMSSMPDAIDKARKEIDDIAQIREGRTVSLDRYRNIGIMAHIDAANSILHW